MRGIVGIVLLAASWPAIAAAPKILVVWTSKSDIPAKPGRGTEADGAASAMTNLTAEALGKALPCSSPMTMNDVADLLDWERKRQLLGKQDDPAFWESISGAVGADYVVHIQVIQSGGVYSVSATAMDSRTGRPVARSSAQIQNDRNALDKLQDLANQFASALGASGPKCPGRWRGSVTITETLNERGVKPGQGPWVSQSSLEVTCQVQPPRPSTCSVNFSSSMNGNGASLQKEASGNVQTDISAGERDGKASVSVGTVSVSGTMKVSVEGMSEGGKEEFRFGPWSATSSGRAGEKSNSGDWTDGKGTSVKWSFTRD
jgi:hypothetical protein